MLYSQRRQWVALLGLSILFFSACRKSDDAKLDLGNSIQIAELRKQLSELKESHVDDLQAVQSQLNTEKARAAKLKGQANDQLKRFKQLQKLKDEALRAIDGIELAESEIHIWKIEDYGGIERSVPEQNNKGNNVGKVIASFQLECKKGDIVKILAPCPNSSIVDWLTKNKVRGYLHLRPTRASSTQINQGFDANQKKIYPSFEVQETEDGKITIQFYEYLGTKSPVEFDKAVDRYLVVLRKPTGDNRSPGESDAEKKKAAK